MEALLIEAETQFFAVHAQDPKVVELGGRSVPWSVHYHRRLQHFVAQLAPEASNALRLAAACAHIRRWTRPRADYPTGRTGYKKWRSDLARFHAEQAEETLNAIGIPETVVQQVKDILQKRRLKTDPDTQTYEDAICLVFIENELEAFAQLHDEEKLIRILRKTWLKMSPAGHEAAHALLGGLVDDTRSLVERALAPQS